MLKLLATNDFNPRSLTGATHAHKIVGRALAISIHAPLRERPVLAVPVVVPTSFQSTLPYGSDHIIITAILALNNFNPRSLTGATRSAPCSTDLGSISIHAPSRERLSRFSCSGNKALFQSTLPYGSDYEYGLLNKPVVISIHAPLRERQRRKYVFLAPILISIHAPSRERLRGSLPNSARTLISIHAPSRERQS